MKMDQDPVQYFMCLFIPPLTSSTLAIIPSSSCAHWLRDKPITSSASEALEQHWREGNRLSNRIPRYRPRRPPATLPRPDESASNKVRVWRRTYPNQIITSFVKLPQLPFLARRLPGWVAVWWVACLAGWLAGWLSAWAKTPLTPKLLHRCWGRNLTNLPREEEKCSHSLSSPRK